MMRGLSNELIAVLAVGATLVGLTLMGHAGLHARMDRMEARLTARIDTVDTRLAAHADDSNARLASVEEKITRLDSLDVGPRLRALEDRTGGPARSRGQARGAFERPAGTSLP